MRHLVLLTTAAAVALAMTPAALGDISVGVGNGDRVTGTIDPPDSVETLRVRVPKGARISIVVKGLRLRRRGPAPAVSFDLIGPDEKVVGSSMPRNRTGRLTAVVATSGQHRVVIQGDGVNVGNYSAIIRWRSVRSVPFAGQLTAAAPTFDVAFDVDDGARLALAQVAAARASAALPRLATLNDDALAQPPKANTKRHTLRRIPAGGLEFGNSTLVVSNAGDEGLFSGRLRIQPPRPSRRKFALTDVKIQPVAGEASATGEVVDEGGGLVVVSGAQFGDIDGSSVVVPAGALSKPTAIVIATSREITSRTEGEGGAGPTVLFGPEGQVFRQPVKVTIPFDPAPFMGDTSTMRVFTRSSRGRVREITDFTVNVATNTVTFFVTSFSSFRAFGPKSARSPIPGLVPPDVNADGIEDLIIPAPEAANGAGAVFVFFGASLSVGDNSVADADVRIAGSVSDNKMGNTVLVRDVTGDGVADVIASDQVGEGNVYVFSGKAGFSPTGSGQADASFAGQAGDGNFGVSVAVGDVNSDGTLDLMVGAEDADDTAGDETGAVYVFFGPLSGAKSASQADIKLEGEDIDDLFGAGLASGDVSGDGIHDVVVGADMIDRAGGAGKVYVFLGGSGFSSRPVFGESAEIQLTGEAAADGFGLEVVVGLVNGDQTPDIVTNAGVDSTDRTGAIYVFLGGAGLASGSATTASAKITGIGTDDKFGSTILVDDIDGVGGGEIVVSAEAEGSTGTAYFFTGVGLTSGTVTARSTTHIFGVATDDTFGRLAPGVPFGTSIGLAIYAPEVNAGVGFEGRGYLFTALPAPGTVASAATITVTGTPGDRITGGND